MGESPIGPSSNPHVAVCIVGFRNPDDIVACLRALACSTYADFEVIVCENGGPRAFAALQAAAPGRLPSGQDVKLVLAAGNVGYAGGVNVCIRESEHCDAWWVLNPDAQPDADALRKIVDCSALGFDAVGCTVHFADGHVESRGGRWRGWMARAVSIDNGARMDGVATTSAHRVDYISGASMLVTRRFIEVVGLMREDYFLYGEEVEWFLRARASGMKLGVAAGALVLHDQGTTTGSVADVRARSRLSVYLDERNKILITRDCWPWRIPVVMVATLALIMLRFARRGAWRQVGFAVQGWWDGLLNARGVPRWLHPEADGSP